MKADTYREHLNNLQLEVEELRAKLKEAQTGDTISRQAALDAVFNNAEHPDKAYEAIRHLPSAQPEIIRCEDCKHYEADIMGNPWGVCCHKDWVIDNCGSLVYEKGWCYRAERRTDDC